MQPPFLHSATHAELSRSALGVTPSSHIQDGTTYHNTTMATVEAIAPPAPARKPSLGGLRPVRAGKPARRAKRPIKSSHKNNYKVTKAKKDGPDHQPRNAAKRYLVFGEHKIHIFSSEVNRKEFKNGLRQLEKWQSPTPYAIVRWLTS